MRRKEFLKKQKSELEQEKFNGDDQEVLQRIKDDQKEKLELKDANFEEERKEIIQRNQPRRKAIQEIRSKQDIIEKSLLDIFLKEQITD